MFVTAVAALLLTPTADPAASPGLAAAIEPLAAAHKGKIAVAVKHLETGEAFALNADAPMPTASLIKLAVMVEAYWQADEGKLRLDAPVILLQGDKVPGSGILTSHFSEGTSFPLRDAVRLMIVYSDNTATNLVLGHTGIKPVNARMGKLGLPETRVNAQVFKGSKTTVDPDRSKKYGLGSTTARESVRLLEMIQKDEIVTPAACKAMLDHLKACDDKDKLVRFLPPGTVVAHKTGSVNASKTDAAIFYVPDPADKKKTHPVAVCVLTDDNEDKRWVVENAAQVTMAKIGRAVYDHFAGK